MDDLIKDQDKTQKFMRDFESFLTNTEAQREEAEKTRDYCQGIQWTREEINILKSRKQIPVTFDYLSEQVDMLTAMERDNRSDPKAYPRTRDSEESAQCVSDALRYVADNNDFDDIASDKFKDLARQGYCAAKVEVVEKVRKGKSEFEIVVNPIHWDRFYYDPHSREKDFSDAGWMGLVVWMDKADAKALYKDKAEDIGGYSGESDVGDDTFGDRPSWYDNEHDRVRVCEHYYKVKGVWHVCHFIGSLELIEGKPVEYKDEFGEPVNPIVAVASDIDRENNRIPYMKRFLDPQREVNHRRSKSLHHLNSKQFLYEKGSIPDVDGFAEELKKPDGRAEVAPGALVDGSVQINPGEAEAAGQQVMYQDAVMKIDRMGANAALQGDVTGMSGRAIDKLQTGGGVQLGALFDAFRFWKRMIYRQIWYRVKQFWDEEKWIRVTDSEDCIKWVGLNYKVTMKEELMEAAEKGAEEAAMLLQQMTMAGDPRLNEVVDVRNKTSELDVDIIIEEGPDTVNAQQEQFEKLAEMARFYGPQAVPFEVLLELSSMPNKSKVKEMLSPEDPMAAQMAQMQQQFNQMVQQLQLQGMQLELGQAQADIENTQADTNKKLSEATQTDLENQTMVAFPDTKPNVNV